MITNEKSAATLSVHWFVILYFCSSNLNRPNLQNLCCKLELSSTSLFGSIVCSDGGPCSKTEKSLFFYFGNFLINLISLYQRWSPPHHPSLGIGDQARPKKIQKTANPVRIRVLFAQVPQHSHARQLKRARQGPSLI